MDEVFVLTRRNHETHTDDYVMQSSNIHHLVEYMLQHQDDHFTIYVTDYDSQQINYLEWRNK